ncbi:MAG: hypothetical protein JWN22_1110 [Nocardioides sp.]|jgi:hypothetical protein|nr:hypothetical protein [Nocardioides sp.]
MSDPLEHLHRFDTEGLDVNPLPASEVRRRGNRMRRRNNALAAVGGLAAVALIAVPLAITAGGNDHASLPPANPAPSRTTDPAVTTAWVQEIPESFPLTEGFPATNGSDGSPVTVQHPTDLGVFPPCFGLGDKRSRPAPTVDKAGVDYRGESEDQRQAVLAVYQDQDTASSALTQLEEDVAGCPRQSTGHKTYLFDASPSDFGEQSFTWTMRLRQGGELSSELYVVQNVRVGNAIYALSYYGAGGANPEVIDHTARLMGVNSAPVISSMCVFAAEPCDPLPSAPATSATTGGTGGGAVSAIPDDFPILAGYPDDSSSEGGTFGISGPTRDGKDLAFQACGAQAPAPDGADQLNAGWTNPEDFRSRQLTTFDTLAEADAYVDQVLQVYLDCPTEATPDGYTSVHSVIDQGLGDRSASAVVRYRLRGSFAPGLDITTVVRVGRAVLLSTTYDEGGAGSHPEQEVADAVARDADAVTTLIDAMCPWSEDGC